MLINWPTTYVSQYPPDYVIVQSGREGVKLLKFSDLVDNLGSSDDPPPSIKETITQTDHGLSVQDVVRLDGNLYVKALADTDENSEVVGIVCEVIDNNTFVLLISGYVDTFSGLTEGITYFLSEITEGLLTETEPDSSVYISKPIFIADSAFSGYFFNFRGITGTGNLKTASEELESGNDEINVTFDEPFADSNYVINITMINTTDSNPSIYSFIVTAKSTTGFTVKFSDTIDSTNYLIDWTAIHN